MLKLNKKSFFEILLIIAAIIIVLVPLLNMYKVQLLTGKEIKDWSGKINPAERTAIFENKKITVPDDVFKDIKIPVLGVTNNERWIEVDLSEQKLKAWEGDTLYLESLVSTGLPWWPTPTGEFRIWAKARAIKMEGGEGKYYYYLPNVPYVMFFENEKTPGWRGYGLHGTYWHNDFGRVHSHGCINLPTPIAQKLYWWTAPNVIEGKGFIKATVDNPGTKIIIHD
jgi:lipoprotein-anchoring transpeptidase ErfK/SrfK